MKKVLFVIITVFFMISLIFVFGIKQKESKLMQFSMDGYIISRDYENKIQTTTRYYFNEGTKYKKDYQENYVFTNTDNLQIKVNKDSFIHYSDKSIATLNKTAILNLEQLNDEIIRYYNFYVGSKLNYNNNTYFTQSLNKQINFSDFIMKISENKYMIVSSDMTLFLGNTTKKINNGYLEFEFIDGNIVRIENQEFQMQNVSSNFYIELKNIKIDLSTKNIFLNGVKKLNLSQITIDKDDNIDIPAIEEEEKTEERDNPLDGLVNGNIDSDDNEEIIGDIVKLKEPIFMITDMDVTSNRFRAEIEYEDTDNLLTGDITLKIIEASNNKIVYETIENSGLRNFQIEVENLKENTNYVFVINSDYIKNENTYNRDFVQKTFITEPIGVQISKNYFTNNELSFNVNILSYSKVEGFDISLINDNDEIIKTFTEKTKEFTNGLKTITFSDLSSNTEYKVVLHNFLYQNSIISDQFNIQKSFKTLKRKPTFGEPTFTIDKKNAEFSLKVNNINDIDDGIVSYKYEIYDARTLMDEPKVLKTIEKENNNNVDLHIDNNVIHRGVPYTYKMIAVFDDNEKQYEYETEYSNVMQLDGVEFPTVRFESNEITFERINGNIIIVDNGNTIVFDESNIITITYVDSSGNSKSLTASGSSVIPFSVNNLRANETYTISLYTTVNLQDGNDVIDNCYIGSVVVQTLPTKPFVLDAKVDSSDTTKAFKITSQLTSEEDINNTLEATTLSHLTFNLYRGNGTGGQLVRTITKVDRDVDAYSSDLKKNYYDNSFVIDPDFFELRNQDLDASYYTIEVTKALDYTTHKNDIGILSNTIVVKTNGYVPDLPDDVDNAIDVHIIRNVNAGDLHRDDLNPNTIIGYKVKAQYDNAKRYAKKINYNLYDANTNQLIEQKQYTIPEDGTIGYEYFYLKDGTPNSIVDNDFRRGNSYYITYTVDLDLNFDGITETVYPLKEQNILLKSNVFSPEKQEPIFELFPFSSSRTEVIWKYKYVDIDNSLSENNLYYKIDSDEPMKLPITQNSEFKELELSVNKSGYLNLYVYKNILKKENPAYSKLVYQYYEIPYIFSGDREPHDSLYEEKKFNVTLETNRIIITILDYLEDKNFYNRVASAKVIFKTSNGQKELDNLLIESNGMIIIDIIELEDFINETITTELYLYYDNGIMGYNNDNTKKYVFQSIKDNIYDGGYYNFSDTLHLNSNESARNAMFNFILNNNNLNLKNLITNKQKTFNLTLDKAGYSYNYEYLFPKQLSLAKLVADGTSNFIFDSIIPGISVLDKNNNQNIAAALTYADIYIDLYGNSNDRILNNYIYIDVYKTNESGTESSKVDSSCVQVLAGDLDKPVRITGLEPKEHYYIKILADVKKGNTYERTQLYDINFRNNQKNYYFKTLGSVGIDNVKISYKADAYDKKYLRLEYTLKELVGYDRIEYELYRIDKTTGLDTLLDLNIEPNYTFTQNMVKNIPIPPGSGVTTNEKYRIVMRAYSKISKNGVIEEIELDPSKTEYYNFVPLRNPYIGISSVREDNGTTLNLRVNIYDYHRVIYNDNYQIVIYNKDGVDITPTNYKEQYFSTKEYNKTFRISDLNMSEEYTVEIKYLMNTKNDISSLVEKSKIHSVSVVNEEGIDVGNVYAITSLDDMTKVNLLFYNSYKLTEITDIRYSIYSDNNIIDSEIEFVPVLATNENESYYICKLPDSLLERGIYYIQIQFLKDTKVVVERAIQYNYVG